MRKTGKNEIIKPRYPFSTLGQREAQAVIREKRKRELSLTKRIGLLLGLAGAAYALSSNPSYAESIDKQLKSSKSEITQSFGDSWEKLKKSIEHNFSASKKQVKEKISEATPVIEAQKQKLVLEASGLYTDMSSQASELLDSLPTAEEMAQMLPKAKSEETPAPDYSTPQEYFKAKVITPAVTRKLSEQEIDEANKKYLAQIRLTQTPVPATPEPTHVTQTPYAKVDTKAEVKILNEHTFSSYNKPFEFFGANQVMEELNFTTLDLLYPDTYRMKGFEDIISYDSVLPIYTDSVNEHIDTVVTEVEKFNEANPDARLSPNIFLSLISIESNGANVESSMAAKGIMQVTTPVAEMYGYKGSDMFNPKINIRVGVRYFAEGYKVGLNYGLSKLEALKYASMYYNGGPRNANNFFGIRGVNDDPAIFEARMNVKSQDDVRRYLKKYIGSDVADGYEYWKFGPRMTRKETLQYAESFERFEIIQKIALELRKKGLSDEEIRAQLTTPKLLLQLKTFIKYSQGDSADYFYNVDVADSIIRSVENGKLDTDLKTLPVKDYNNSIAVDFIRF